MGVRCPPTTDVPPAFSNSKGGSRGNSAHLGMDVYTGAKSGSVVPHSEWGYQSYSCRYICLGTNGEHGYQSYSTLVAWTLYPRSCLSWDSQDMSRCRSTDSTIGSEIYPTMFCGGHSHGPIVEGEIVFYDNYGYGYGYDYYYLVSSPQQGNGCRFGGWWVRHFPRLG